jgi:amidophosphoribosyltransferase
MSVGEIREYLGCDSLAYLDLDRLVVATGNPRAGFCTACLTGEYPIDVPLVTARREEPAAPRAATHHEDSAARG